MSSQATAIERRFATRRSRATVARGRLTQAGVLRSEWTKLYSLRSTRYSLLATSRPR